VEGAGRFESVGATGVADDDEREGRGTGEAGGANDSLDIRGREGGVGGGLAATGAAADFGVAA
jgi:hypothetical protein